MVTRFAVTVDQSIQYTYDLIVLPAGLEGVRQVEEHVAVLYLSHST